MILGIVPKRVFLRALWEFRSLSTQMSNLSASNLRFTKTVYRYRISFSIFVYIPGTLNNNCSTDVWWNTHLPFKDLESSDWNNRLNSWMARVLLCSAAISTPPSEDVESLDRRSQVAKDRQVDWVAVMPSLQPCAVKRKVFVWVGGLNRGR